MIKSTNQHVRSIVNLESIPIDIDQISDLQRSMVELNKRLMQIQKAKISRSKRKMLAQFQVVGSTIEGTEHTNVKGHDVELTHITPSKDLVTFENQRNQQRQKQHQKSTRSTATEKETTH